MRADASDFLVSLARAACVIGAMESEDVRARALQQKCRTYRRENGGARIFKHRVA